MARILVWDLPTRLFHWLLSIFLIVCWATALLGEDDPTLFSAHMILGIVVGAMVLCRIIWGFIGTRHARFSTFVINPQALINYLAGAMTGSDKKWIGHNPASSYAIFTMLTLVLTTVVSGLMMSGGSESSEEIHELSSYALMAAVVIHITGVLWYSIRHRENITMSMVSGYKEGSPAEAADSNRLLAAIVFLVLVGVLTIGLFLGYDRSTGRMTIPLLGIAIDLGESGDTED